MNVLWITNKPLPEAVKRVNGSLSGKVSESWIVALAEEISEYPGIKLYVASICSKVKELEVVEGERISHFLIPQKSTVYTYCSAYERIWKTVNRRINPSVVHIHGTERPLGLSYVKACGADRVVVSIQGMVSEIDKYFYAQLSFWDRISNITIHDILKRDTLFHEKKRFYTTGKYEKELLATVQNVIGRTSWDYAHCNALNPSIVYHFCNEILRKEFYSGKWEYKSCEPCSMLISQANTPLKGAHFIIKALPYIINRFPDAKLYIAGGNPVSRDSFRQKMTQRSYGRYLEKQIKRLGLLDRVIFIGYQSAVGMKDALLKSNVFISASSIENSPNSLGEAQLLGVPCVSSFVGGAPDFIQSKECGFLYRFDDYQMLAECVCESFVSSQQFDNTKMRKVAGLRHDRKQNIQNLISIYNQVSDYK